MAHSQRPATTSISANGATADRNHSSNKKRPKRPSKKVNPYTRVRQASDILLIWPNDFGLDAQAAEPAASCEVRQ
jgi:hypothetical protein